MRDLQEQAAELGVACYRSDTRANLQARIYEALAERARIAQEQARFAAMWVRLRRGRRYARPRCPQLLLLATPADWSLVRGAVARHTQEIER